MHVIAFRADEIIGELHIKNVPKVIVEIGAFTGESFIAAKEALQNFTVNFKVGWCWCAK